VADAGHDLCSRDAVRMVLSVARKFRARVPDWQHDDLRSAALYGLAKACRDYDPVAHPDTPFLALACIYARTECRHTVRELRLRGYRADPLATPPEVASGVPRAMHCHAPAVGWEVDDEDAVRRIARHLPPGQRDAVLRRYLFAGGKPPDRIARRAFQVRLKKAMRHLRSVLS